MLSFFLSFIFLCTVRRLQVWPLELSSAKELRAIETSWHFSTWPDFLAEACLLKAKVEVVLATPKILWSRDSRCKPLVHFIEHALVCCMLCRVFSKAIAWIVRLLHAYQYDPHLQGWLHAIARKGARWKAEKCALGCFFKLQQAKFSRPTPQARLDTGVLGVGLALLQAKDRVLISLCKGYVRSCNSGFRKSGFFQIGVGVRDFALSYNPCLCYFWILCQHLTRL